MGNLLLMILINALAIWLGARFLRGVEVEDFPRAVIVGIVVIILNVTLGKILNFFTLGLVGIIVDALVLMVADYFLKGLRIKNFWWALALAFIVWMTNWAAHVIF